MRSTSRVYEIYYSPEQQNDKDYLCTVRCGLAASDTGEAAAEGHDASSEEMTKLSKERAKTDTINSNVSDEDGWIEVKVPDSPLPIDTSNSMEKEINQSTGLKNQDYYEATAEITDANPCISLTLRLLSLQDKGCVSIEEIYIFAEPVESVDVGYQSGPVESSANSNLLAMLVPSLLQLSSKSGVDRVHDKPVSDMRDGQKLLGSGMRATDSIRPEMRITNQRETPRNTEDPRETFIRESAEDIKKHMPLDSDSRMPDLENIPEFLSKGRTLPVSSHLENMLVQLDSRVARIETFCARFEENMLKPLNYMATKIQQLEQKMDELTVGSRSPPRLISCLKITAPEFSSEDSELCTLHTNNNRETADNDSGFEVNDVPLDKPSPSNNDATASATANEFCPHLLVSAPEFVHDDDESYDDDGNQGDNLESEKKDLPLDKPSLSIDSALASALASFLLSASTPALMIKAPDFVNEDDTNDKASPSAGTSGKVAKNCDDDSYRNDGMDNVKDSDSTPCTSSRDGEVELHDLEVEAVVPKNQFLKDGIEKTGDVSMQKSVDEAVSLNQPHREQFGGTNQDIVECANESVTDTVTTSDELFPVNSSTDAAIQDISQSLDKRNSDSSVDILQASATISTESGHGKDRLENELKQVSRPMLDFELPILDVQFSSQENRCLGLPLETLLSDAPEIGIEDFGIKDNGGDSVSTSQQNHLVLGETEGHNSLTVNDLFRELENLNLEVIPSELEEPLSISIQEPFPSLI